MTDPRKPNQPGGEEEREISLPSWVDDAIARSRDRAPAESQDVGDVGPASEVSVAPPQESGPQDPASLEGSSAQTPEAVEVGSPMDARRRAVMPWVALALIFLAAALVLGYILLTSPR